jgi:hypothetical protein
MTLDESLEVNRRLPITEARIRPQVLKHGIHGGRKDIRGGGFSHRVLSTNYNILICHVTTDNV